VNMNAQLALVVTAFATIALLMVLLMRVRLERDPNRGWKPDSIALTSPPRSFYVLRALGYGVLAVGLALCIVIHRPWPLVVAYVVLVASVAARVVIMYRLVKERRKATG
jgi:hypothetical protein